MEQDKTIVCIPYPLQKALNFSAFRFLSPKNSPKNINLHYTLPLKAKV